MVMTGDDFDWTDKDSVVVPSQEAIAIYENAAGNVVIRVQRAWNEDEDAFIVIARDNLPAVIEALKKIAEDSL
jgi:hypothetical protein